MMSCGIKQPDSIAAGEQHRMLVFQAIFPTVFALI